MGPRNAEDLWVAENGAELTAVIGAEASNENPADELNLVDLRSAGLGKSYGFPFCHTGS